MMSLRRLMLAAAVSAMALTSARAEPGPIVTAPAGTLEGTAEGTLHVFKGIPYALPPVGRRRWNPPAAMPPWSGVKTATQFGPECVQPESKIPNIYSSGVPREMSEDCLTLNIWAPANAQSAPVLVWIHGGALWGGSNSDPVYDGKRLAERGIVVVAINYRLGVLGWLAHPELSRESRLGLSGNYGLLDQIRALTWVKDNISAFGGNPGNVTIAGQSAGGLSVMYLMASPVARGLFAKAIAQSAYMASTQTLKQSKFGIVSAEDSGLVFAAGLHVAHVADLRALDAKTVTNAAAMMGFAPFAAVDGRVLPDQLVTIFDERKQAPVPILAGFNSGEIRSLRMLAPPVPASAADYEKTIRARYGDIAEAFLKLYPSDNLQESIWATTRDALYGWTAERLVRKQTALGMPSYLYLFDHGYPAEDTAGYHAFHGSELPYMFGTMDKIGPLWPKPPVSAEETKLTDAMLDYWTSFARSGKPTAVSQPDWPALDADGAYMNFSDAPHPSTHLMPGMYLLNEEVMCRRRAASGIPWNWNVGLASPTNPGPSTDCRQ